MASEDPKLWNPSRYSDLSDSNTPRFAVIVLNIPIQNYSVFSNVVSKAAVVIAADGGANRMKDYHEANHGSNYNLRVPDAIVGDLDSLLPETHEYFASKGIPILRDPSQYYPDFKKCLNYISENRTSWAESPSHILDIVVFGGLGGRADQAFSQLHYLYTASQDPKLYCGQLYLYSEESIMFFLNKGMNRIHTPVGPEKLGENVGIIPLANTAIISTSGLEWDVKDWETGFGSPMMSTSNHIKSEFVTVETNERVLFTVELDRKPSANYK